MNSLAILAFLKAYWGLVVVGIGGAIYFSVDKYAQNMAKEKAKEYIIEAEYQAELYALKTGKEKFEWVVETAYPKLPAVVKSLVTKEAFKVIVQYVFDMVVDWAEENVKKPA